MGEYREWFDAMGTENAHRGSYADNMGKYRESTSSPDFILLKIHIEYCSNGQIHCLSKIC